MDNIRKTDYQSTEINISVIESNEKAIIFEGIPWAFYGVYHKIASGKCEFNKNHLDACCQSINLEEPYF